MHETERERSMALSLLISMLLHATLFLIGPTLVSGLFPSTQPGEQGGLTYVTLVDTPLTERPRAAVSEAARRPESRPEPARLPEPKPQAEQPSEPTNVPVSVDPPQPARAPEVTVERIVPEPADERPQVPAEVTSAKATLEPLVTQTRPQPVAPAEVAPTEEVPVSVNPVPVLTATRGEYVVPVEERPVDPVAGASSATAVAPEGSSTRDEPSVVPETGGDTSGSGALHDQTSAAPDAVTAPEPVLPPTGISMVSDFGGAIFPKDAVGLVRDTVTVEVAVVVDPDGTVVDAVLMSSSGLAVVDVNAMNIATRLVRFKPYDSMYELRVFITYNGHDQALSYRTGDFIKSPPTVGRFGSEAGQ